jgi:hypothetical protein
MQISCYFMYQRHRHQQHQGLDFAIRSVPFPCKTGRPFQRNLGRPVDPAPLNV